MQNATASLARSEQRASKPATVAWLAALALLAAAAAWPQGTEKSKTLRVTTRLVNLSVVVRDAQGHLVKGLKQSDFTILDEGKPQRIGFFSAVDNEHLEAPPAPPAPDTYTNVLAGGGAPPSVAILLFDALNSTWISQGYGLFRIRKLLRQLQPGDHIGIYVLRNNLYVVHDFTHDASDLVRAIHRYDEHHAHQAVKPEDAENDTTGDPELDRFLSGKDFGRRFSYEGYGVEADTTLAALRDIARQLYSVPGRKTLIWVTDSIGRMGLYLQRDLSDFERVLRQQNSPQGLSVEPMIRLMNDANISLYLVNASGLGMRSFPMSIEGPMMELASRTGGRAFVERNDLETGIRRAMDDSSYTYSMAYTPDHGKWEGEWRKIQVRVDRQKAEVLTRGGYWALPDSVPGAEKDRLHVFREVAASPVNATELPLRVHVAATHGPEGARIEARVHLDVVPMLSFHDDGHWTGDFELMFVQSGGHKILTATPRGIHADLKPQQYPYAARHGWDMPVELKVIPGAEMLSVILYDDATNSVGSVHIPLARYIADTPAP